MTFREFFEELLGGPLPPGGPELSIKCFHHDDEHNSCSLNLDTGLWFCHSSGEGGNAAQAYAIVRQTSKNEARRVVDAAGLSRDSDGSHPKPKQPPIAQGVVDEYCRALHRDSEVLERARKSFGWSDETIKRREVGWVESVKRYAIPVRDEQGDVRNVRMYDPDAGDAKNKMISWKKGYGEGRIYPADAMGSDSIILCEGEKDTLLMEQILQAEGMTGWGAVTGTGGAGTWKSDWNDRFRDKDVYVVYDNDESGRAAALRAAEQLDPIAKSVKIITLDIADPPGADVTDYFLSSKGWADFQKLLDETPRFSSQAQVKRPKPPREVDESVYTPHLSEASDEDLVHKKLRMQVIVAGKDLAPYAVPKRVVFDCNMDAGPICKQCSMLGRGGSIVAEFDAEDPEIVNMVKSPDQAVETFVRRKFGVHTKCRVVETDVREYHTVEECTFVPEIDFSDKPVEYVSRTAYVMQHGVQTNQSYEASGTSIPHPRTQHVVHFIPEILPAQDNIDKFEMTDEKASQLEVFQVGAGQTVSDKMREISHDLASNVTRIYGREDLIQAIDMCYHTVLSFDFQGKPVAKPWGDILIIGDTRTGKTETLQALIRHYRLGELSLGENMSFAGLVGGLRQEAGKRWSITWGKIPLNDRRLLAIDETSGLSLEVISSLSGIRSNGVAEMTKIVSQKTMARTRLVFLSNPRSDRTMSEHSHGVEAVKDLIGRPEDVARFDFVVSAATNEVPMSEINAWTRASVPHSYTSELCRNLLLWTWSRTSSQVTFTDSATMRCLDLAIAQAERYSAHSVPLVEGGNHRIKLAKLAVAVACRLFSTTDAQSVIVHPEHVEFAADFLDRCYGKSSLDYTGHSDAINRKEHVEDVVVDEVKTWVGSHLEWADLWMTSETLRIEDVKTAFDLETKDARQDIFKPLMKWRMIERVRNGSSYAKTSAFIRILKDAKNGNGASSQAQVPVNTGGGAGDDDDDLPF